MKTRAYFVTAAGLLDTAGLYRVADALLVRMRGEAGRQGAPGSRQSVRALVRSSALLIKIMKMVAAVTLRNNCFLRRREVLGSPKLRARVLEQLGGVHAATRWRRKHIWNKGREACIAAGQVPDPRRQLIAAPKHLVLRRGGAAAGPGAAQLPQSAGLNEFRFPPLRDYSRIGRPRARSGSRAAPVPRYPSIVVWPHELDGQYVPGFQTRCTRPAAGDARSFAPPPGRRASPDISPARLAEPLPP